MRRRLVGDDVGHDAAAYELGQDVGGVGLERDRPRFAGPAAVVDARQRVVERIGALVDVAGRQPALDALGIDLDHERDRRRSS